MENIIKYLWGAAAAVRSFFAPISELVLCAVTFVGIDLVTGVWAGYAMASRAGVAWRLESAKAWRTVVKLVFVLGGIVLAWLVDYYILAFMDLKLANLFTGFVCGVEFWSYMENASDISGHPVFEKAGRFLKNRFGGSSTAAVMRMALPLKFPQM